jgi:hypothetical protein
MLSQEPAPDVPIDPRAGIKTGAALHNLGTDSDHVLLIAGFQIGCEVVFGAGIAIGMFARLVPLIQTFAVHVDASELHGDVTGIALAIMAFIK